LILLSTSLKPNVKEGLHKKIKEDGLMKLLSTSLKPSVKKGLQKKIKEEPS
jgi:hypothetical protein